MQVVASTTSPRRWELPSSICSQPCLLKLVINHFLLMAKKKEARRKDTKSVDQEEQAWCENQVAYVWCPYLVSGDSGQYQAKVSFRAEMVLATCLAVKELK